MSTLTPEDTAEIENILIVSLEKILDKKLEEKFKPLLTKKEFFDKMDELIEKLKDIQNKIN